MREGTVQPNGGELKRRRMERGWTQQDLADKAGCSKRTIENAEAGKPSYVRTLADIAYAFGESVSVLDLIYQEAGATRSVEVGLGERIGNAPPLPPLLIGRDADLKNLIYRLTSPTERPARAPTQVLTAVRGWPGVGKTTLARAIAHSSGIAAVFPDGVLWTSLGPLPTVITELIAWGRALRDDDILHAKILRTLAFESLGCCITGACCLWSMTYGRQAMRLHFWLVGGTVLCS